MTRNVTTLSSAMALGLSAIVLSACGRAPTAAEIQDPAPATSAQNDGLATREQELARREADLEAQQEALRQERERVEARRAAAIADPSSGETRSEPYDADESIAAVTPVSSVQKVPTPPVVVPPGTTMQVELTANVNTKTARVGDRVEGRLASDLMVDDRRAAVAGATVTGKVTELVSGSDKVGGVPTLGLTFDSLQAANGATIPIVARYRKQGDSDTGEDTAKVVGGAAAGAVIGHQVGNDDKGTVVGGILGGAAGAAAAKKTGGEVKLRAGKVISVSTETSFSIY